MSTEPQETDPPVDPAPPAEPPATPPSDPPADPPADPPPSTPTWPENWRDELTGGDEKELKRLERAGINSPADSYRKWRELENRLNGGEYKKVSDITLPDDATDEQIAAYRKANGIPEDTSGYYDALSDGLVIGDEDKPIVDSFLESVHAKNVPPSFVNDALQWYYSEQQARADALAVEDKEYGDAQDIELRDEWGPDYRPNMNAIKGFRDTMPEGLGEMLDGARLNDGTPMLADARVNRWLLQMAQQANPLSIPLPGVPGDVSSIQSRIDEIETKMKTDRKAYNADTKMQDEYVNLVRARERLKT